MRRSTGRLDHTGVATAQCGCAPPRSKELGLLCAPQGHCPRSAVHLLREAGLRLWHSQQIWAIQGPRKMLVATGSQLTVWQMQPLRPRLQQSLVFCLCLWHICLSVSEEGHKWQPAQPPLVFIRAQSFVLWALQGSGCSARAFLKEWSFAFLCFSEDPTVWVFPVPPVLCHISPPRVSSWRSTLVLYLWTTDTAQVSPPGPHSVLVGMSLWAAFWLVFAIWHDFCGKFSWLCFSPKLLTDPKLWEGFLLCANFSSTAPSKG